MTLKIYATGEILLKQLVKAHSQQQCNNWPNNNWPNLRGWLPQ